MLLRALQTQDMYLAGSFLMMLAFLTVIGVLVSDLALAVLDPRIRFGGGHSR
jgi:peptide/nickel transport system permease protein